MRQASRTPGSKRRSEMDGGGYGFPSRTMARFSTPSRSRNTARRILEPSQPRVFQHRAQRDTQCLPCVAPAAPAQVANAVRVQTHHRNVALPAAVPTRVFDADALFRETHHFHGQPGDLVDGDVVAGGNVIDLEILSSDLMRLEDRFHHVIDVDIRLALRTIPQYAEPVRLSAQPANEIEPDAVRLARAHHVAETERAGGQAEHRAIRSDQCLARQLTGPVSGDRNQRTVVFFRL